MPENAIQHSHIYSTYFAPRGRSRIFNLGIQLAQLYLSPFDQIIGVIGEAGSGKSVLIKGMFPGLELTNDDDGVNVRRTDGCGQGIICRNSPRRTTPRRNVFKKQISQNAGRVCGNA